MIGHKIIYNISGTQSTFTLLSKCYIKKGFFLDWKALKKYHYKGERVGAYTNIFTLNYEEKLIGIVVFSMPPLLLSGRSLVFGDRYSSKIYGRKKACRLVNAEIRVMQRLVIHPQFRGVGLAWRLLKNTQNWCGVPIVESLSEMGKYSNFMGRAGYKEIVSNTLFKQKVNRKLFAFVDIIGIDLSMIGDKLYIKNKINELGEYKRKAFIQLIRKNRIGYIAHQSGRKIKFSREEDDINWLCSHFFSNPNYYYYINNNWKDYRKKIFPKQLYLSD